MKSIKKRVRYKSLGRFVEALERAGELIRIDAPVDPELEVTEITDRVSKSPGGGKALLFENVIGSNIPILINAFGARSRMARALGVEDVEEIAAEIESLIKLKPPSSLIEKIEMAPMLYRLSRFAPKIVSPRGAPCQEVIMRADQINLMELPILKCWPQDGGRFITLGAVFTKSPVDSKRNVGLYRMQIFNRSTTGMHWHIHKDGAAHFDQYRRAGRRMEVAVAIGADPAVVYSATAPLPHGVDEMALAGFIRQAPVELVKCVSIDMEVPRDAEIILEGYVDPSEARMEGPFGDHTGYYSLRGEYPVFHLSAITRRSSPIYLTTIVGKPPMEDCHMAKATERIFAPLLRMINPEIIDYNLPWEGVFHNCVIVSIAKRYPAQARRLMSALWGAGQMSFAKMVLLIDSDIAPDDYESVARAMLDQFDPDRSITLAEGVLDVLDHSAPEPLHGSKLGIDATRPIEGEPRFGSIRPTRLRDIEPVLELARSSEEIGAIAIPFTDTASIIALISVKKRKARDAVRIATELLENDADATIDIVVALEEHIDPTDYSVALWKFFNNVDPRRDITTLGKRTIVDATKKLPGEGHGREWPDEIEMSDQIKDRVTRAWSEFKID